MVRDDRGVGEIQAQHQPARILVAIKEGPRAGAVRFQPFAGIIPVGLCPVRPVRLLEREARTQAGGVVPVGHGVVRPRAIFAGQAARWNT